MSREESIRVILRFEAYNLPAHARPAGSKKREPYSLHDCRGFLGVENGANAAGRLPSENSKLRQALKPKPPLQAQGSDHAQPVREQKTPDIEWDSPR